MYGVFYQFFVMSYGFVQVSKTFVMGVYLQQPSSTRYHICVQKTTVPNTSHLYYCILYVMNLAFACWISWLLCCIMFWC